MNNTLFSHFPTIIYNGVAAVDITKSISMVSNLVSNTEILSAFVMNEPMRSDQLARQQYNDPEMDWLVWMANGRVDSYDWYMNQSQFFSYLNSKYGDYTLTQQQIKYYINNWYNGQTLTIGGYNSLPSNLAKYYQPVLNASGQPIKFIRTQEDWIISTNHIVQYNVASTIIVPQFTDNEIVTVTYAPGITANGQVCYSGMAGVNLQHMSGNYAYNGSIVPSQFSIVGSQSGANLTITNVNQLSIGIYNTLSDDEYVFYDPVTIFDDENIKNEARKYMYYLPNNYISQAMSELKNIFQ